MAVNFSFNGNDYYIIAGYTNKILSETHCTLMFFVKLNDFSRDDGGIISQFNSNGSNEQMRLSFADVNSPTFLQLDKNGGSSEIRLNFVADRWYAVMLRNDPSDGPDEVLGIAIDLSTGAEQAFKVDSKEDVSGIPIEPVIGISRNDGSEPLDGALCYMLYSSNQSWEIAEFREFINNPVEFANAYNDDLDWFFKLESPDDILDYSGNGYDLVRIGSGQTTVPNPPVQQNNSDNFVGNLNSFSIFQGNVQLSSPPEPITGNKFEPADGRVIHGLGHITGEEPESTEWLYQDAYTGSAGHKPVFLSTYFYIDETWYDDINGNVWNNWDDALNNHGAEFSVLVGITLFDTASYLSGFSNSHIDWDGILGGQYDQQLDKLIITCSRFDDRPIFIRPAYEFGGSGGIHNVDNNNSTKFKQTFRYIRDYFENAGVTNVAWVWNCVNPNTFNYMDWYPGDDYVDWWAFNAFKSSQLSNSQGFVNDAAARNKPVLIGEACPALGGGSDSQGWYDDLFSMIRSNNNIKAFCYLNEEFGTASFFSGWSDSRISEYFATELLYSTEMNRLEYIHYDEYINDKSVVGFETSGSNNNTISFFGNCGGQSILISNLDIQSSPQPSQSLKIPTDILYTGPAYIANSSFGSTLSQYESDYMIWREVSSLTFIPKFQLTAQKKSWQNEIVFEIRIISGSGKFQLEATDGNFSINVETPYLSINNDIISFVADISNFVNGSLIDYILSMKSNNSQEFSADNYAMRVYTQ